MVEDDALAERACGGCALLPQPGLDAVCVEAVRAGQCCDAGAFPVGLQAHAALLACTLLLQHHADDSSNKQTFCY